MQLNETTTGSKHISPNNRKHKRDYSGSNVSLSNSMSARQLIRSVSYNTGFINLVFKEHALAMSLSHSFRFKPKPFTRPRLKEILNLIQVALRCRDHLKVCREKSVDSFIEFFTPVKLKQGYGVPLGGIGSGTIGRTSTGDFSRFQLVPGMYEHETVDANMFTVCIRKSSSNVTSYQQSLVTRRSKLKGLRSWNMAYCGDHATYFALYPESWTTYDLPGQHVNLTCHQLSPVIPHNYKDSSLPVSLFQWTVENKGKEDIECSIMFTWQAGSATDKFSLTDVSTRPFENYINNNTAITGVAIQQRLKNMPLEYCIAAKKSANVNITYNCQFYPDHETSGNDLWFDLLTDGKLDKNEFDAEKSQRNANTKVAIAVCVKVLVKSASKENVDFSLVWHMPEVYFSGAPNKLFKRFYTRYFPNSSSAALDISCYALENRSKWLEALMEWRKPILYNKNLSNFLKCCLFNELYFISDGGTIWLDVNSSESSGWDVKQMHPLVAEYGRFAYLEGHEYRMYNTYDVHFYANFALVQLWPKLQLSMQYDFAESIGQETKRQAKFIYEGVTGSLKVRGSMPHDIGDPEDLPWDHLNAYCFHDTKDWKDLNLKFILTVFRDYNYLRDMDYLKYMWPHIKTLMVTVQSQDRDGDGLIDSEGLPDQTYDAWSVTGASAYCGGLHVATLRCVVEMARALDDTEAQLKYEAIFERAQKAYNDKLWNGEYYKYDSDNSSIMADMCCGHWYFRCSGMKYEAFEREKIRKCLETIHEYNVIKYGYGKRGAVNGMRPNGTVDTTSLQSEEMWIGITCALASLMIYEGMEKQACDMLEAMYELLYNQLGLAFQTPEGLVKTSIFRSLGYMRPLCIWSVLYAFENR